MEEQNKYYTPDISELHVGYECEHTSNMSAFICEDYDDVVKDKLTSTDLRWYITWGEEEGGLEKFVRTKYLDQSDIEGCGWEKVEESSDRFGILEIRGRIDKKYPGIVWAEPMGVFWNICCAPVQINNPVPKVSITKTEWGGFTGGKTTVDVYAGECKSINELKKIMQWLNIK